MADKPREHETDSYQPHNGHPLSRTDGAHGRNSESRRGEDSRRSLRVLVVDDDPEVADDLALTIGDWGHDVRWICEGTAALQLAISHQAEVVLLDIALSGMSGYTVAQNLRREPRLRGCLLLALRWPSDKRRDKQFREADIDMFLAKPVDLLVLETLLALERDRLAS
jgi:CheY-like chemotaxis protein